MIKKTVFATCLLVAAQAHAGFIVDTGTPDGAQQLLLDAGNSFAGQFMVAAPTHISAIHGWLDDLGQGGGTFTVSIYDDAMNIPGAIIDSAQASFSTPSGQPGWNGLEHLDWLLGQGTYWATFQVDGLNGDSFSGAAPVQAPQPMIRYAFDDGSGFHTVGGFAPGVLIESVPEPATLALLCAGILGAGAAKTRRRLTATV